MSKRLDKVLVKLGACDEAREWCAGKTVRQCYDQCERPDWLLWYYGKRIGKPGSRAHRKLVRVTCECVKPVLPLTTDPRPAECVRVTLLWCDGKASLDEVRAAAEAVWATGWAAAAAGTAAAAAAAAVAAAAAAAEAARAAGWAAARGGYNRNACNTIRSHYRYKEGRL